MCAHASPLYQTARYPLYHQLSMFLTPCFPCGPVAKSRIREKSRTPDPEQPARRLTAEEKQWMEWASCC